MMLIALHLDLKHFIRVGPLLVTTLGLISFVDLKSIGIMGGGHHGSRIYCSIVRVGRFMLVSVVLATFDQISVLGRLLLLKVVLLMLFVICAVSHSRGHGSLAASNHHIPRV